MLCCTPDYCGVVWITLRLFVEINLGSKFKALTNHLHLMQDQMTSKGVFLHSLSFVASQSHHLLCVIGCDHAGDLTAAWISDLANTQDNISPPGN